MGRPSYMPEPVKASFFLVEHGLFIECLVNPSDIRRIESVDWVTKTSPGSAGHDYQYGGGGKRVITLSLILDGIGRSLNDDGVLNELSALELMVYPAGGRGLMDSEFKGPGTVLFTYGLRTWEVVVKSMNVREVQHDSNLNPIYVIVQLDMLIDLLYSDVNEALHSQRKSWAGA